jgi:hypothetical protein
MTLYGPDLATMSIVDRMQCLPHGERTHIRMFGCARRCRDAPMRIWPLLFVVVLVACAPTPEPEPTPTPTPTADGNVGACEQFIDVFNSIADANADRDADRITVDEWYAIVDDAGTDYSAVALIADGDLKTRIEDLVDLIDEQQYGVRSLHGLSADFDLYKSYLDRIGQVCTAAGVPLSFSQG